MNNQTSSIGTIRYCSNGFQSVALNPCAALRSGPEPVHCLEQLFPDVSCLPDRPEVRLAMETLHPLRLGADGLKSIATKWIELWLSSVALDEVTKRPLTRIFNRRRICN